MTSKLHPLIINHKCTREPEGGLHRVKESTDRILELQKVESMRKMMLMQEQVFKQQVQELHRLYNLQKKLMQETERLKQRKEIAELVKTTKYDLAIRHQAETESIQSFHARNDTKEQNSVKFVLEMPSSSIQQFEEQNGLKKIRVEEEGDVGVELTLSIGHCTELQDCDQASTKTDKGEALYGHPSSISLSTSSVYQENTRPHWLLQDLSLNRR